MTFIPQGVYVAWGVVLLTGWAATLVYGVYVTFTARRWGWLVLCVIPVTCVPAAVAYAWIRRQEIERAVLGDERVAGGAPAPRRQEEALSDPRAPRRRHPWRAAIIFLVIIVALFLIVPRLAGQAHAVELLQDATPAWLVVAVVVECVSLLFYSLLFRRLLGLLRYPVTLGLALRINLAGLAAAHLFSAGGVGGAAVTYRVLQKRGMPHSLVLIAVIFQNAFAYIVLFALFAAGLTVLILRGQGGDAATRRRRHLRRAAAHRRRLRLLAAQPPQRRCAAAPTRWWAGWSGGSSACTWTPPCWTSIWTASWTAGGRLRREGWGHLKTVGLAVGYWGFDIVCLLLVMLAFHQTLSPDKVVIAYAVANVVGTFSPTPGGLGAVEGVMIALLVGFGMPSAAAVAVVLVYRLINFWLPIPAGLVTYLSVR